MVKARVSKAARQQAQVELARPKDAAGQTPAHDKPMEIFQTLVIQRVNKPKPRRRMLRLPKLRPKLLRLRLKPQVTPPLKRQPKPRPRVMLLLKRKPPVTRLLSPKRPALQPLKRKLQVMPQPKRPHKPTLTRQMQPKLKRLVMLPLRPPPKLKMRLNPLRLRPKMRAHPVDRLLRKRRPRLRPLDPLTACVT